MIQGTSWFSLALIAALSAAGCGDSSSPGTSGTGGRTGTGGTGGMTGTGGTGGSTGSGNEDAMLTYEGEPLLLDTVNVCLFGTDGTDSLLNATIGSEEGAPNQISLTLGSLAELIPGRTIADTIAASGSLTGIELDIVGQLDLVDFDPDMAQVLTEGTCTVDFTFNRVFPLGPTMGVDVYDVSFECPMVVYQWLNTATSMLGGSGVLTDLSGTFPCFMSEFT